MTDEPNPAPRPPLTLPSTSRRDWTIGITIGVVLIGLIFYAISTMSVSKNLLTGTITAKRFIPGAEQQVTIGQGGVHARQIDGEYILDVSVKGHPYNIWVDKEIYEAHEVGDSYTFVRPAE